MKRFFVFFIVSFFVFVSFLFQNNKLHFDKYDFDVQIFSNVAYGLQSSHIKNGYGEIYYASNENYLQIMEQMSSVAGVTYIFDVCKIDARTILKNLQIDFIEQNNCFECVGFCDAFDCAVLYQNKKVNVQTTYCNNKLFVGTPLLLGGY